MNLSINQVSNLLNQDNLTNKKKSCHLSNDILIQVCNLIKKQDTVGDFEIARNLVALNRGSTFEVLVKALLNEKFNLNIKLIKSLATQSDIEQNAIQDICNEIEVPQGHNLEIKLSTSFAYASGIAHNSKDYIIVCNQQGAFGGYANELITSGKDRKIPPNQYNFKYLKKFSKLLGYQVCA